MAASPVLGAPQFLNIRSLTPSTGTSPWYDGETNGQTNITPYSASVAASHTISAGPCTVGPVFIAVNGIMWVLPFNQSVMVPDYVVKCLDSSQWTYL